MPLKQKTKKLVALPVQVVEVSEGVVLKRGASEIAIKGQHASEAVRMVLKATRGKGASLAEIQSLFDQSDARHVEALIENLVQRRILVPDDKKMRLAEIGETNLDIFFWNFGQSSECIMERLNEIRLVILGVNSISRQLALSLAACGYRSYLVLDHPRHRNIRYFSKDGRLDNQQWPASLDRPKPYRDDRPEKLGDCLVATSDFGSQQSLCVWNKVCLDQKVKFLPVILKNLVGYVGPLVIPGETACFECLLARQRSHSIDAQLEHLTDAVAFEGQGIVGFHPSMATILGDIAAFEITSSFGVTVPKRQPGWLLEVDLIAGKMVGRTVVKVPRCAACSPLHKSSQTNLMKTLFPEDV